MVVSSKAQEYLEREEAAETKSEFICGEIVAMAGASFEHIRIVTDTSTCLNTQLAGKRCEVFSNDLRVFVEECDGYFYPDIVATCGKIEHTAQRPPSLLNPKVIIEVLSESTANRDRGVKFACYRTIPSLQDYIVVSTRAMTVDHYTRISEDQWMLTVYRGSEAVLEIASIGCSLPLKAVYARVEF